MLNLNPQKETLQITPLPKPVVLQQQTFVLPSIAKFETRLATTTTNSAARRPALSSAILQTKRTQGASSSNTGKAREKRNQYYSVPATGKTGTQATAIGLSVSKRRQAQDCSAQGRNAAVLDTPGSKSSKAHAVKITAQNDAA